MSEEGKKEAFCPLLFYANGGSFDSRGRPEIIPSERRRGVCTRPYDCNTCVYMHNQISYFPQEYITWVCPECLIKVLDWTEQNQVEIQLWGFYSEGYCEYPWCSREGDPRINWPARYSILRQIVYGPIR